MKRLFKRILIGAGAMLASCTAVGAVSYALVDRPEVAKTVIDDSALPSLEVLGVNLHLQTFGDPERPTVIALHGGPGNDFRHLLSLRSLSDDFHLVLYDQPGAGLSQRVEGAGHMMLQEKPDEVVQILRDYLKSVDTDI